jgi:hypothetical protein
VVDEHLSGEIPLRSHYLDDVSSVDLDCLAVAI